MCLQNVRTQRRLVLPGGGGDGGCWGGQYATVRLLISHHIRSGLSPPSTGSKSGLTGNTRGKGRETRKRGGTHRGRAGGNRGEKRRLCLWSVHIIFEDIRKKRKKASPLVFGRSGRDAKRLCEDGRCRGRAAVSGLPPRRDSLAVLLPMRLRLPQDHGRDAPGLKRGREGRRRRRRGRRRRRDKEGKAGDLSRCGGEMLPEEESALRGVIPRP